MFKNIRSTEEMDRSWTCGPSSLLSCVANVVILLRKIERPINLHLS